MAGAYLEITQQQTFSYTANITLNGAGVELYQSVLWFTAATDTNGYDGSNLSPFINLVSTSGSNITISNAGTNINSVVNITLTAPLTANLAVVNSAFWQLVTKTTANAIYSLDHGRIAVLPRLGMIYQ